MTVRTQEVKENKVSFVNALNLGKTRLAAGIPPLSPPPPLFTPELGPREPTGPPLYDKGQVFPSKIRQKGHWKGSTQNSKKIKRMKTITEKC